MKPDFPYSYSNKYSDAFTTLFIKPEFEYWYEPTEENFGIHYSIASNYIEMLGYKSPCILDVDNPYVGFDAAIDIHSMSAAQLQYFICKQVNRTWGICQNSNIDKAVVECLWYWCLRPDKDDWNRWGREDLLPTFQLLSETLKKKKDSYYQFFHPAEEEKRKEKRFNSLATGAKNFIKRFL